MSSEQKLGPVGAQERLGSVDVLRGFALLGILAMNIYAFSMPMSAFLNPSSFGGDTGADLVTWFVTNILVETKFMTIFSAPNYCGSYQNRAAVAISNM